MKRLIAAAALAAMPLASTGALAADLPRFDSGQRVEQGAFAGARVRVELGGKRNGSARAGLALAPIQRSRSTEGEVRVRYGEGLELGFGAGAERPTLRVAGQRFADGRFLDEEGRKLGLSTIEAAAIVGGVILLAGVVVALAIRSDDGCCE